jgi:hypothetical protein
MAVASDVTLREKTLRRTYTFHSDFFHGLWTDGSFGKPMLGQRLVFLQAGIGTWMKKVRSAAVAWLVLAFTQCPVLAAQPGPDSSPGLACQRCCGGFGSRSPAGLVMQFERASLWPS